MNRNALLLGFVGLCLAGGWPQVILAEQLLEAHVINITHEEKTMTVVDEECGEVAFDGRLQRNSERVVHLCQNSVGKGDVTVYVRDTGRQKRHRHVPPNGSIMVR